MDSIDFKELVNQEPEFNEFLEEVLVKTILRQDGSKALLHSIHSLYQIGLTADQVARHLAEVVKGNE